MSISLEKSRLPILDTQTLLRSFVCEFVVTILLNLGDYIANDGSSRSCQLLYLQMGKQNLHTNFEKRDSEFVVTILLNLRDRIANDGSSKSCQLLYLQMGKQNLNTNFEKKDTIFDNRQVYIRTREIDTTSMSLEEFSC